MAHQFIMEDAQQLSGELGISFQEAAALLLRADGDCRLAAQIYHREHPVFAEPEQVCDGTLPIKERIAERVRGIGHIARGNAKRLFGVIRRVPAGVLIAALAMLVSPKLGGAYVLALCLHRLIARMGHSCAQTAY